MCSLTWLNYRLRRWFFSCANSSLYSICWFILISLGFCLHHGWTCFTVATPPNVCVLVLSSKAPLLYFIGRAEILSSTLELALPFTLLVAHVLVSVSIALSTHLLFPGCLFSLIWKDEFLGHLLLQFGKSPLRSFPWALVDNSMLPPGHGGFSPSLWSLGLSTKYSIARSYWLWARRCDLEEVTSLPSQLTQLEWMRATRQTSKCSECPWHLSAPGTFLYWSGMYFTFIMSLP